MKRCAWYLPVVIVAVVLCACAGQKLQQQDSWQQRQQQLENIVKWRLQGRISLRQGEQAVQANIDWQQDNEYLVIQVYGSFGLHNHELRYDQDGASLLDPKGNIYYASSIQELMLQELGWSTPEMFSRWVRGLPGEEADPGEAIFDPQGRLSRLYQGQWDIEYLDYVVSDGVSLPRRIRMRNGENLTLLVAIHNWEYQGA